MYCVLFLLLSFFLLSKTSFSSEIQETSAILTQRIFPNVQFVRGFAGIESWGIWTNGDEAQFEIDPDQFSPGSSHVLTVDLSSFLPTPTSSLNIEFMMYGQTLYSSVFNSGSCQQKIEIPIIEKYTENLVIYIKIVGASSPFEHGMSEDRRKLGLGFNSISIDTVDIFNERTISQYHHYFDGAKDFRQIGAEKYRLFKPVSYTLKTINFGEESFYRPCGWFDSELTTNGGEVFALSNVVVSLGNETGLIVEKDSDAVLYARESVPGVGYKTRNVKSFIRHFPGKSCLFRPSYFFSTHYYDFLLYFLPSINFLDQKEPSMKYFMHKRLKSYEREGLQAIGLESSKIIPIEPNLQRGVLHASFEEAYFTSLCNVDWKSGDDKEYFPEVIAFLREKFLDSQTLESEALRKKIYISRADAQNFVGVRSTRSPYNEIEICSYLETLGFEIITLDGKTIREQARIFNESSVVIAPHGAGLTNIVFCQPGTKVLELFSPRFFSLAYIHLSSLLNLKHAHIMGDTRSEDVDFLANFHIDLEEIKSFLDAI